MIVDSKNVAFEGIDPNLKVLDEETDAKRWESLNKLGELLTEETYESWKEELHNLLIFAGLFSAIVTTFTNESSKAVRADYSHTTVLLLQTIVLQLNNQSNPQANLPINLNPVATPSINDQRINTFYSSSLALSLFTVLGGIVCLQWLREFGRNIRSVSNKEDLSLQYQRHKSLRVWGVLFILYMLPLLLLISLGLFFTGFTFSQWESTSLASRPVTSIAALSVIFTIGTTILPTCQFMWLTRRSPCPDKQQAQAPPLLCPYRSPQSWLFHLFLQGIFYIIDFLTKARFTWSKSLHNIRNWMDYDTKGIERWKEGAGAVNSIHGALLWISGEYRQTTTVALDAYACMIYASCLRSWKALREQDIPDNNIEWEWEEQGLLTSFEIDNKLNRNEFFQKVRAKAVIDATVECHRLKTVTPLLPGISALEKSIGDMVLRPRADLLHDINTGLKSSDTKWTVESAVAVACHMIDEYASQNWLSTIPILEVLCQGPNSQSLCHIRHLCEKLREKLEPVHKCHFLINIFNDVFPSVNSVHWADLVPILGGLLVKCEKCSIHWEYAKPFLKLVEGLASNHLIAKEHSLNRILLHTPYIIQHSWGLPDDLVSIQSTLGAILSAAEKYVQDSPERSVVLHPDYLTMPHTLPVPGHSEDLQPVWTVTDCFNESLKRIWRKRKDVEKSSKVSRNESGKYIGTSDTAEQIIPKPPISSSKPLESKKIHSEVVSLTPLLCQNHSSNDAASIDRNPHPNEISVDQLLIASMEDPKTRDTSGSSQI